MFVVETRRNSSPQIDALTKSHSGASASEMDTAFRLSFNATNHTHNDSTECINASNHCSLKSNSSPIADASPLDRHSLLLRAVTSRRSQSTRPAASSTTNMTNYVARSPSSFTAGGVSANTITFTPLTTTNISSVIKPFSSIDNLIKSVQSVTSNITTNFFPSENGDILPRGNPDRLATAPTSAAKSSVTIAAEKSTATSKMQIDSGRMSDQLKNGCSSLVSQSSKTNSSQSPSLNSDCFDDDSSRGGLSARHHCSAAVKSNQAIVCCSDRNTDTIVTIKTTRRASEQLNNQHYRLSSLASHNSNSPTLSQSYFGDTLSSDQDKHARTETSIQSSCPPDCVSPVVCKRLLSLSEDMNLLVRNITKEAKTLVHAETCSLFLLDKEHSELVAEVFEKNGTSDEYLTEIRMPLSKGIVGHVASTGQMMNVDDVYNHPFFYPKVDERTGFVTRNILCFPIKDSSGNLVGVAELCNKIGKQAFTRHDEQIATTFAVYCAISISHCLLYRKLQEAHRRSHMAAELLVQGSTLSIAPEDILRFTVRDIPASTSFHPDFTQFFFIPRSIGAGDTYIEASLSMFKELQFIEQFRLRRRTLARFLLMVQKGYRDVPYHNWSHAFAVGHFCFLLVRTAAVRNALTDLERLSLFVACLCHDIDHRGTTNAFQLQSKTPLAQLYSSEGSVLERHHFAQTVSILSMEECNIFDQLNRQQYQTVLDNIREIILATDIAAHLRKVDRIKKMVEDGYDRTSNEHHYLLMCLLMTAADLSDQSKDFKNSKAIAENIYKEFFSQGDLEKQMGNRPLEMMDRDRACVPKIQLEFMDTVALPVFDYVSRILPDVKGTYNAILLNRRCWHVLDQILKEEGLPRGGLDYLRNVDLDEKVMKRIAEEDDKQR